MIRLADIIKRFEPELHGKYGSQLLPGHHGALAAILRCRTEQSGSATVHCGDCGSHERFALSCGHRFCPSCQNEAVEHWLERQRAKLLPVKYYLITFTLPAQLRPLAFSHQKEAYDLLIKLAWGVLSEFGLNDQQLVVRPIRTA